MVLIPYGLNAHKLDQEYSKDFTDLIELVYGNGLLSQGGKQSIDAMFAGIDLNGKKILDIGSGLGGVDFYLAQKYSADIIGVDCVARMVQDAQARALNTPLKGSVQFTLVEPDTYPYTFADATFDIVFSKEALLHVENKEPLIKELLRVLKQGGQLVILDWLVAGPQLGPHITHMMEVDGLDLKMATLMQYIEMFWKAGFNIPYFKYLNDRYVTYTNDNIATIKAHHQELVTLMGEQTYVYALDSWHVQRTIFEHDEVLVTLLKVQKPYVKTLMQN